MWCGAISDASYKFWKKRVKLNNYRIIPGWNREVKALHSIARISFFTWVRSGKLRGTIEHEHMIQTRKNFKEKLKKCKKEEKKEQSKSIVEKFHANSNKRDFWKEIRKKKGKKKIASTIDGETNPATITNVFTEMFLKGIDASEEDVRIKNSFIDRLKNEWPERDKMYINISRVSYVRDVKQLNDGMGHDGIHSRFLKMASQSLIDILCNFLNLCFSHCYMPPKLLIGNIRPIVKDKKGNLTDSSNYRPVMQSSCLLKIIEIHILDTIAEKVSISEHQYGFRRGTSTSDACFILKEIMFNNSHTRDKALITFVDLSKAFDRVNHYILGNKLLDENVPVDIILFLMHYLRNQAASVVWGEHHGHLHPVEKGVRQGGILSPLLFKIYINSILQTVSCMDEGCLFGINKVNVIAYADDICLIARTKEGMEALYLQFTNQLIEHQLIINKTKTKCMKINVKQTNDIDNILKLGDDNIEIVSKYKYLGHVITQNLQDGDDVEVRLKSFYASFYSVLRNFKHTDENTLLYLFKVYCLPDYGLSLWNFNILTTRIFKVFEVAFSNSLKRMIDVPTHASSHEAAENCNQLLLRHHLALIQARYLHRLINSKVCIIKSNIPLLYKGNLLRSVLKQFENKYSIDVTKYDLNTITARIKWVQRHETRRTRNI